MDFDSETLAKAAAQHMLGNPNNTNTPQKSNRHSLEAVSAALSQIPALVWGEEAMDALEVVVAAINNQMIVVPDKHLEDAAKYLRDAGFGDCEWSCGTRERGFYYKAEEYREDEMNDDTGVTKVRMYKYLVQAFEPLDKHTIRFLHPSDKDSRGSFVKVVLLPASYAHINFSSDVHEKLEKKSNLYYPDAKMLIQSFRAVAADEKSEKGLWKSLLLGWVSCVWAASTPAPTPELSRAPRLSPAED